MTRICAYRRVATLLLIHLLYAVPSVAGPRVLDDFEELEGWAATPSEGASVNLVHDVGYSSMGMRIDFDLNAAGGYVIVRKEFPIPLPANYAFTFHLRGEAKQNNLEFKLIDPPGKNVWWWHQRGFVFPEEWQEFTVRKSRIEFAWGPAGGKGLKQVGAISFAIASGAGGKGSVWIDNLEFEEREPVMEDGLTPVARASSERPGNEAALALDGDAGTSWKSAGVPDRQWLLLDLTENREYGGLVIDWDKDDFATAFEVQVSTQGKRWTTAHTSTAGSGGRDYIYMPDAESRYVRLWLRRSSRGKGFGIADIEVQPVGFSASPNNFFEAVAREAQIGTYPKYFYGTQTYWTVVGVNGDDREGLLNEEGMLEVDKGSFSIEPFLYVDGKLVTWNTVLTEQSLEEGSLPIPSVTWKHDHLALTITAFAGGEPGASALHATYAIENGGDEGKPVALFLAIRPFQVNPPWQSINSIGGVASIRSLRFDGRAVWVNRDKVVIASAAPERFGAASFHDGSLPSFLLAGRPPPNAEASDPYGFASGALQYAFQLGPHAREEVALTIPFHELQRAALPGAGTAAEVRERLEATRRYWKTALGRVELQLPPEAAKVSNTLKSTLAYILINRDGGALQPGSRNYERSWIRDGAVTGSALLGMGFPQEVRDFIRWYAPFQQAGGRIPCCVDGRGADPVSEHDSHGEFIYTVAEYYRFTRDVGFLNDLWGRVAAAAEYISSLRRQRMTRAYRTPDTEAYYGLVPESISHEGYASHPVHSYWDDFFSLRGLDDAAELATVVGDDERAARFAALADDFRKDISASIARTMARHGIDYVPGSVELGDFDPTSTAIALVLDGGLSPSLAGPLRRTFDRYYDDFKLRWSGQADAAAYTPYEFRNVEALIRLEQRQRGLEIFDALLADQRPAAWNQWAEIAWHDRGVPKFIGDMPHTWVGAIFVRAVRSMFAYERRSDRALVIAAGLPAAWVTSESGVTVKRLPTYYGTLNYTLRSEGDAAVRLRMSGDLLLPPGKIVVQSPLPRPLAGVTVNGERTAAFTAGSATIEVFPADVVLEYGSANGQ